MPIKSEKELFKLLEQGWRIHYDKRNKRFKVADPKTRKSVNVSHELDDLCRYFYKKMKAEKKKSKSGESDEEVVGVEESSFRKISEKVIVKDTVVQDDVKFIVNLTKQKVDPKAPLITKWTENIAWWNHIILDAATYLLPELLSMLRSEEIDLSNPETTIRNIIIRFKAVKGSAAKISEIESKYISEIEALKKRIAELEDVLRKYEEIIDEQNKIIDYFTKKTKETMSYIVLHIPNYLPEDVGTQYKVLLSHIREIWSEEMSSEERKIKEIKREIEGLPEAGGVEIKREERREGRSEREEASEQA